MNGQKSTIIWHGDNLKMSHTKKHVVEDLWRRLTTNFGKEIPPTTSCRKS